MSDPFYAEIRIFPFNFAPRGWAQCNGQLLPIASNTALFSLLGTFYGGDGKSTFALPDLQGAAPMHHGQGPGLSDRWLGEEGGTEGVTLLGSQVPAHAHQYRGSGGDANSSKPGGALIGTDIDTDQWKTSAPAGSLAQLHPAAISGGGGDQPHNNMQPYLTLNFCISLSGIFPQRN